MQTAVVEAVRALNSVGERADQRRRCVERQQPAFAQAHVEGRTGEVLHRQPRRVSLEPGVDQRDQAFKLDVSPELAPSIAEALRALVGQAPSVEGLVPLIDAGLEGDTPWLAMEHLSCPTLDMRLREGGLLPLDEATALVRALADAVDTAHAHGLDHGSLHPRDVFLPEGGGVVVSGFGVAAAVGVAGLRPPRRRPFTAPETLAQKPLDAPADRYALGVIAYEIVSGRRLLGAGDDLAAGLAARAETSDVPRAATALAAMLAERPEHRPSTATAFAQALCAALESPPSAAETIATTAVIPTPPSRPARPPGEPPTSEALAEFARQGTFWEPPRRGADDSDAATVVASGPPPSPARASDDPPTSPVVPLPVFLEPETDVVSVPVPELEREPEPTLMAETVRLDPPLRVEPVSREASEPTLFRTFGDAPERTAAPVPVVEQVAHTPPLVVLALTLGLGLAVGAAGGYLVGHRSGERAAQRALGGETGTTSATYGDTAPSTPSGGDAGRPRDRRLGAACARWSVVRGAVVRTGRDRTGAAGGRRYGGGARPSGGSGPGDRSARHPVDAKGRRRPGRRLVARPHADHRARADRRHARRSRRRGRLRRRDAACRRRRARGRHHGVIPAGARPRARASGRGDVQAGREDRRAAGRVAAVRRRRPHRRPRRGDDAAADLRSRAGPAPGAARAAGAPPMGDEHDHRRRPERARRRVARGN